MHARLRAEDGVSIIEIVAAVLILGIAIAGLSATLINSLNLSRQNANRVVAANLAASEIERLLTMPFGLPEDLDEGTPATGLLALLGETTLPPEEVDGRPFTLTRNIYWSTTSSDHGPCPEPAAEATDENVLRIDVSVTWPRPSNIPPVRSSTSVAPPVDLFASSGGSIAVHVQDHNAEPQQFVQVNLIGPTETTPATVTGTTNEFGCVVFGNLSIGTYHAVLHAEDHVDIDQRHTQTPVPITLEQIGDTDVTGMQGVAARSRATISFAYAEGHELTVTAEGWDGGTIPAADLTWKYFNSRPSAPYAGGPFGASRLVYPGTYAIYSDYCVVEDPAASIDTVVATPAGGQTDATVTFGTFTVRWADDVAPDPGREVTLTARAWVDPDGEAEPGPDPDCDDQVIDLGTTTVGGTELSFALPWAHWKIEALEDGSEIAEDVVTVHADDIATGTPPEAVLDAPPLIVPGPGGVMGPAMWLDADDAFSVTATAGAVSEWRDQTIWGRDATQATAGSQPTYVADQLNGRPVMRFDGASDFLSFDGSFLAESDYTILIVGRRNGNPSGPTNMMIGGETAGTANDNLHLGYRTSDTLTHAQWANDYDASVASFTTGEPARIHTFVLDQGVGKAMYEDGELLGSRTDANGQAPLTAFPDARLGRFLNSFFNGDLAEIVIYPRALTAAERLIVEAYLADKWIAAPEPPPTFDGPDDVDGLQLWMDGADEDTIFRASDCTVPVSSGFPLVRCWQDKSGNSRNAIIAGSGTGGNRPTFVENALNGRSALRFDGSNSYLTYNGSFLVGSDYTVFVAHRRSAGASDRYYLGGTSNQTNRNFYMGYRSSNEVRHSHWVHTYDLPIAPFASGEPARVHTVVFEAGVGKSFYDDGTLLGSATGPDHQVPLEAYPNAQIGRILTTFYFPGDVAEILMYDRALTPAERGWVQDYLSDKWGTP